MTPDIQRKIIDAYRHKYGRVTVAALYGTTPDVVRSIWDRARLEGSLPSREARGLRVRTVRNADPELAEETVEDDMMRGGMRIVKYGDVSLPYLSCLDVRV